MITYRIIKEVLSSPDHGRYSTFGICAVRDRETTPLLHIADIFTEEAAAQRLAARCNALRLDPLHLRDAVEDALEEAFGAPSAERP